LKKKQIKSLIIDLNSIKKGIVIIDHNYQNTIKIATQLILVKEGKTHVLKEKSELVDKGYLTTSAFL